MQIERSKDKVASLHCPDAVLGDEIAQIAQIESRAKLA